MPQPPPAPKTEERKPFYAITCVRTPGTTDRGADLYQCVKVHWPSGEIEVLTPVRNHISLGQVQGESSESAAARMVDAQHQNPWWR